MLLRMVESLKIIDIPFSLTRGGPGSVTQTYVYYAYEKRADRQLPAGRGGRPGLPAGDRTSIVVSSIYFYRVRERFE